LYASLSFRPSYPTLYHLTHLPLYRPTARPSYHLTFLPLIFRGTPDLPTSSPPPPQLPHLSFHPFLARVFFLSVPLGTYYINIICFISRYCLLWSIERTLAVNSESPLLTPPTSRPALMTSARTDATAGDLQR
jgi:hypothetical protein